MKKLKNYKRIIVFLVLILLPIATRYIDSTLVSADIRPIFVLPGGSYKDGGTTVYYGLGYKAIGWKKITVKQINGKEVSGWMKGYEISFFPHFQDIKDGPQKELKFIPVTEG
jgi:hypothetical protein